MTAAVGSSVVGQLPLAVMVLQSGTLLMLHRGFGSDDGHRVDAFRNLSGLFRPAYSFQARRDSFE